MNLRVWIDYNGNGRFEPSTETALTADNKTAGTYTANITVPSDAKIGTTRLRVTAKMTSNGGHISPSPCDSPADALGYHGEIEDYTINITKSTGILNTTGIIENIYSFPNPATGNVCVEYLLTKSDFATIELYN